MWTPYSTTVINNQPMSRQDGTIDEEEAAIAIRIAAAQQQAAAASAPFGMAQHGMPGSMPPPMMGMMPPNFFGNQGMSMNHPSVAAAMMAQSQRQQQATAFSQSAANLPFAGLHHHPAAASYLPPAHLAAHALAGAQPGVPVAPRLVHDAASAPRQVEAAPLKRKPGRPAGSKNKMRNKFYFERMKESLLGRPSDDPYFYPSDSGGEDSSDNMSISNINSQGSNSGTKSRSSGSGQAQVIFGSGRPEMPPPQWYASSLPLGLPEDRFYLSELQCLLRSDFIEVFGTTEVRVYVGTVVGPSLYHF